MSTVGHDCTTRHSIINAAPAHARLLATLLVSVPLAALGDVVVPSESVETSVNIRAEADASAEIIGELRPGESVQLVASIEHWHEVALADGHRGFISSDWTDVVDDDAASAPIGETAGRKAAARGVTDKAEEAVVPADDGDETPALADDHGTEAPEPAADGAAKPPELAPEAVAASEPAGEAAATSEPAGEEDTAAEPGTDDAGEPALSAAEHELESAEAQEATAAAPNDAGDSDAAADANAATETVTPPTADRDSSSADTVVAERRRARERGARAPQSDDELGTSPAPGSNIEGTVNYLTKFTGPTTGGDSQVFDDGINVGIGTTEPEEPLDVNGNLLIYNRNSNLAVVSLRQASGDAGYITHNLAGTLIIGAGSEDRITILGNGNIGVGTSSPTHPLEMASGAHVTAGGVWTNASSRDSKQDIEELGLDEAMAALGELKPVLFSYKVEPDDTHVGFIAEDAPELVASKNRRGLSAMDIVAVLTRVVQAQQQRIEELESRLDASGSPSR